MRKLILISCLVVALAGCAPVVLGTLIVKSSRTKGQKQEFMNQLQRTNTEREAKGLKPLDWCSEAYRFDRGWAMQDPECSKRIKAYEAGNTAALGPAELVSAQDSLAASKQP